MDKSFIRETNTWDLERNNRRFIDFIDTVNRVRD